MAKINDDVERKGFFLPIDLRNFKMIILFFNNSDKIIIVEMFLTRALKQKILFNLNQLIKEFKFGDNFDIFFFKWNYCDIIHYFRNLLLYRKYSLLILVYHYGILYSSLILNQFQWEIKY